MRTERGGALRVVRFAWGLHPSLISLLVLPVRSEELSSESSSVTLIFVLDRAGLHGPLLPPGCSRLRLQGKGGGVNGTRCGDSDLNEMNIQRISCGASGDKLYVGTATGNLHVYTVKEEACMFVLLRPRP